MDQQRQPKDHEASSVSIVERDIPDDTWQGIELDLAALRTEAGEARRRWDASVSTTRTWATARLADQPAPQPADDDKTDVAPSAGARRVPAEDIIVVGRIPRGQPPKKSLWRELFFLGMLAATLWGAYHTGRMNAQQRVIVIPIPESRLSMIT